MSIGFFDDIFIPQEGLQHPSKFDEREQIWVWEYKAEDDGDEMHEMYMDKGEAIRFRITGEVFCDTTPIPSADPLIVDDGLSKIPFALTVINKNKNLFFYNTNV